MENTILLLVVLISLIFFIFFARAKSCGRRESFVSDSHESLTSILSLVRFKRPISHFARGLLLREILPEDLPLVKRSVRDLRALLQDALAAYGYETEPARTELDDKHVSTADWNWSPAALQVGHTERDYFSAVYPNSTLSIIPPLYFLYNCAPVAIKDYYAPFADPETSRDYAPAQYLATWRPIWFPRGLYMVNLYPPNQWWKYPYLNRFGCNSSVEGIHIRDDNASYPVYGYWLYVARGTGVFYNLGNTLRAVNKIQSLHALGMSVAEIAQLIAGKRYYRNPRAKSVAIADVVRDRFGGDAVKMVEYLVSSQRYASDQRTEANYEIDRVNNTADFDDVITRLAKSKGYDTVQFQVQANGLGSWCHEVVFVSPNPLRKERELDWSGWVEMRKHMFIEDPNGFKCAAACEPVVSAERGVITCAAQCLDVACLGGAPNPY